MLIFKLELHMPIVDSCVWLIFFSLLTCLFVYLFRESYRSAGLYWVGSFINSILVFLPGTILGKSG